jgi:hypothetical protein
LSHSPFGIRRDPLENIRAGQTFKEPFRPTHNRSPTDRSTCFRFLNLFGIHRFKNGPARFSETVGEIFFSASLNPKLRSRAKIRGGDENQHAVGFG